MGNEYIYIYIYIGMYMYLTKYESSYRCIICFLFGLSRHLPSPRVIEKKKLKNLKRKEKKNQRKYCLTKLKTRKQVYFNEKYK